MTMTQETLLQRLEDQQKKLGTAKQVHGNDDKNIQGEDATQQPTQREGNY